MMHKMDVVTVGDLRHLLSLLDEDGVSDDMPIAKRGGHAFTNGFEVEVQSLTIYGEGKPGSLVLLSSDETLKNSKGPKRTFDALTFW